MVKGKESRLLFRRLKLRLDRTTNFAIVWNETKPPPFDLRAYLRFEMLDLCRILLVLKPRPMRRFFAFAIFTLNLFISEQEVAAQFVGFNGVTTTNDYGNNVIQVYARFEGQQEVILSVFGVEMASSTPAIHNDLYVFQMGTGSWDPSQTLYIPGIGLDPSQDSFVTLGDVSNTCLDPGFGDGTGSVIPTNAGWFNCNPGNPIFPEPIDGFPELGYGVLIGQFVFPVDMDIDFFLEASVGYKMEPSGDLIVDMGFLGARTGCTDSSACNYDGEATEDDGSCIADGICGWSEWGEWGPWSTDCGLATRTRTRECLVSGHCSGSDVETGAADIQSGCGCTHDNATNYDPSATTDDGSCLYGQEAHDAAQESAFNAGLVSAECPPCANSDCPGDFTADGYIGVDDILSMLSLYDTSCAVCGNGIVEDGECCDDGNDIQTDGCNACMCEGSPQNE